jgi:hypothetical protein
MNGLHFLIMAMLLTTQAAFAQSIERALMPGEVIEGHHKYEEECAKCHKRFDKSAQTGLCLDCHKSIRSDINLKKGLHGHLENSTCSNCHTEHKGRNARIAHLDKKKFDHDQTGFRLQGAHKRAVEKCESCHEPKRKYREVPVQCGECHRKDDMDKGHKGKLGNKCESCHNDRTWKEAKFDHEKTRFSLIGGKHAEVKCKECHADNSFQKTPTTCVACHKKDDQEKGHKGQYGSKCESCHNDKDWKKSTFNHDVDTHYLLKGKHGQAKCTSCHLPSRGLIYKDKLSGKCVACHKKDDQEKGHRGGLGDQCESCHNEKGWKTTNFDHDKTKFPLHEKHKEAKCESCHKGGVSGPSAKLKLEMKCVACHGKDDQEKGHKGRYGDKCESCHTEKDWKATLFNHDKSTKFILKGKHRETRCDDCHLPAKGKIYESKLETTCYSCHRKDDKHRGQLGMRCESCHGEDKWAGVPFNHSKSRFPLTGSHVRVECKKCHLTPAFRDAPTSCIKCHEKDDKHHGAFGTKCDNCHRTGTWQTWDFDHATTKFRVDGGHMKLSCADCHGQGRTGKAGTLGRSCFSCHGTEDPHNGNFGIQCEQCHVTSDWLRIFR